MTKNYSVKETLEVIEFLDSAINGLADKLQNDGKVDVMEWAQLAMENAPEAYDAVLGIERVDDELKNLNQDEIKQIGQSVLGLASSVKRLMGSGK